MRWTQVDPASSGDAARCQLKLQAFDCFVRSPVAETYCQVEAALALCWLEVGPTI
jgi:hypothetical protein